MESNIKRLKEGNNSQEIKLQNLMNELSACKASKVKCIEVNEGFDVIDEGNKEGSASIKTKSIKTNNIIDKPSIKSQDKKNFPYPDDIKGACRKSDINRVFHNLKPYFNKCFDNNKVKRAEIGFSWQINEDGKVKNIKVIKNNIFNRNLSNCLTVVLSSGRYNSPNQGVCEVSYIFKLR